jgi:hypothetical protein
MEGGAKAKFESAIREVLSRKPERAIFAKSVYRYPDC